jgi:hypothetical protein
MEPYVHAQQRVVAGERTAEEATYAPELVVRNQACVSYLDGQGMTQDEELKACVKSFFEDYLNIRECSDAGYMWAPIAVSCARAMKLEPLGNLLERMRILSGARKARDE